MSDGVNEDAEDFEMTLDHLKLEREHTCLRMLTWRCTALESFDVEAVLSRLQRVGFSDKTTLPGLRVLEHPDRHTISFVEATGRMQIKVHYMIETEHRIALAVTLARQLDRALED